MGGSSGSGPVQQQATTDPNAFPGGSAGPTFTMQPAMPGQLEAVAQQLGLAYGQVPAGLLAHMGALYQPMVLPDYAPNRTAEQGANPKTVTPTGAQSGSKAPAQGILDGYSDYGHMYGVPTVGGSSGGGGSYVSNPYYFPGSR